MEKSDIQSDVQNSCFFGYLDILGFKNIVKDYSSEQLKGIVEKFTIECARAVDMSRSIYAGKVPVRLKMESNIHVRIVSDSIYVWTERDDHLKQFDDLLHMVSAMMVSGFQVGLPLRGVVTYGELFLGDIAIPEDIPLDFAFDVGSVYGRALVEAYELESQMDWSGVLLTPKAWNKVKGEFERGRTQGACSIMGSGNLELPSDLFNHFPYLLWYEVPFKSDKRRNAIVFNWNYYQHLKLSEEMIRKAFVERCGDVDDSVKKKFNETIRYFKYSQHVAELYGLGLQKELPIPDSDYVLLDIDNA